MTPTLFLRIPAHWMRVCGYGDEDGVFPVESVRELNGWTFVTVIRNGQHWIVNMEMRGAIYEVREI
jgi:chorismate mutase